jgi:multimeric flavodoxin WrbA
MKIVAINGGLRRGCRIDSLIGHLLVEAHRQKAETTHHVLCLLKNFQKCQDCRSCQLFARYCVLNDDLAPVLSSLESADVLVMGTAITGEDPTVYFNMFLSRFYSFLKNNGVCRLPAGKKAVIMLSHGALEADFQKSEETFRIWLEPFNFSEVHWVIYQHDGQEEAYRKIESVVGELVETAS